MAGITITEAMVARIHAELEQSGVRSAPVLPVPEEQAIARARQGCAICDGGVVTQRTIAHHNLRSAELGERSYPFIRREGA